MRKTWKKLLAYGVAGALAITSLSAGSVNGTGNEAEAAEVGSSITGSSTNDVVTPDNPAPFRDLTSDEIIEEMGIGWNLGNTMDGWTEGYVPGETAWQKVKTTKSLIKAVHDMGFNTIRIPVTWGSYINEDYSVYEAWMSRVQDIVDYCISENMYVMINVHHDGANNTTLNADGSNRDEVKSTHGWLDINGTDEEFAAVREKFNGLWKTIAERFKNYDEHLIFASMNEIYDSANEQYGNLGWSDDATAVNQELERINALNQDFVDTVRATGSNNAKRWLDVPTKNTQIKTLIEDRFNFVVPTDEAGRIMVEAHDYDGFSANSMRPGLSNSWANQFKKLKEQYVDNGIPVVIGEYGFPGNMDRPYKYEGVAYLLQEYKITGVIWDNNGFEGTGDNYGLIDRSTETSKFKDITDATMRGFYYDTDSSQVVKDTTVTALDSFTVSTDSVELEAGESTEVTVSDRLPEESNDVVLWKSDDAEIASVSNGKITGRAVGTTTITAFSQSGTVEKTITVTVNPQTLETASTGIQTDYDSYEIEYEGAAFLNGSALPAGNGAYVTYKSSDESVVSVSAMGKVVSLASEDATATITATTSDGISKEIQISVVEPKVPEVFDVQLALHVQYNDDEHQYFGSEIATDVLRVTSDGLYTLKFDCATDLSESATSKGVTTLNNVGAIYIKDWDVTKGNKKKSPNIPGKIRYESIKMNGTELLKAPTLNQDVLKSGIFDTGNPFNVWDGSVDCNGVSVKSNKENTASWLEFDTVAEPTVLEVTFALSGFTGDATEYTTPPVETASPSPAPATPTTPAATVVPTDEPSAEPTLAKGTVQKVSGVKYKVTNAKNKTVDYQVGKKNATKATVPATVKLTAGGEKVSYKVTGIAKNAFKGNKKLTSVTIGKNVTTIKANAFNGCKKLKKIAVKTTKLRSVGKNALKGVNAKCKITVPKKKKAAYTKLFKNKGQKKSVKVVKA